MTVSPSSQKVDDFLSSLSQLSQERLSQDQSRQRALERNLNELRTSASTSPIPYSSSRLTSSLSQYSDAPSLKFHRDKYHDRTPPPKPTRPKPVLDNDAPPALPKRRDESPPPELPRRRDESPPPALPKRKEAPSKPNKPRTVSGAKYDIELVMPVARKEPTPSKASYSKPTTPKPTTLPSFKPVSGSSGSTSGKYRSFADMESSIRSGNAIDSQEPPKPMKPAKADWLTSSMSSAKPGSHSTVPKPSYLSALSASQNSKPLEPTQRTNENRSPVQKYIPATTDVSVVSPTRGKSTSWIDSAVNRSPGRDKKPVIKPKPEIKAIKPEPKTPVATSKSSTEQKPAAKTEFEIKTLKPVPKPGPKPVGAKPAALTTKKPSYNDYKNQDNELLLSQLSKIKNKPAITAPKPKLNASEGTEELQMRLSRLSPTRSGTNSKPSISKYHEQDTSLLSAQISKLGKKTPPKPEKKTVTEPIKPQNPSKPLKPVIEKQQEEKPDMSAQPPALDFKAQLSSIIRAGTAPQLGSSASPIVPLQRSETDPEVSSAKREDTTASGKLTHPNKSRAKGPKRRLPKTLNTETNTMTKAKPPIKPKPKVGDLSTTLKFEGDVFL